MAPRSGVPLPLSRHRRWQVVLGSVGQPRDRNPAAAYAILDQAQGEITFHRVGYDTAGAAAKILSAGLPHKLAYRLALGHEPRRKRGEKCRLQEGQLVDGFTLIEAIKRGGMARIWRVTKAGEGPLIHEGAADHGRG